MYKIRLLKKNYRSDIIEKNLAYHCYYNYYNNYNNNGSLSYNRLSIQKFKKFQSY